MKFFIKTLGCKVNYFDSAYVSAALQLAGHVLVEKITDAEIVFVNSCTVTHAADRDSKASALQALRKVPKVYLYGCGPAVDEQKWKNQLPNCIIFSSIVKLLHHFNIDQADQDISPTFTRTRVPIVIQNGCDNTCTFCVTRIARGSHSSVSAEEIIKKIQHASKNGVKEIVLTGINLAAWGSSNSNNAQESKLGELLQKILKNTNIPRIRLSSLGPQFLHKDFWEVYRNPRICDYLHLSIQSGSSKILKSMNRGYDIQTVEKIITQARKIRPDTAISADFIVGFPGESEQDFQETCSCIQNGNIFKLHVFPFSARNYTPAAFFSQTVSDFEKKKRVQTLIQLEKTLHTKFLLSQIGKEKEILTEKKGTGLTSNYIRVKTQNIAPNTLLYEVIQKKNLIKEK